MPETESRDAGSDRNHLACIPVTHGWGRECVELSLAFAGGHARMAAHPGPAIQWSPSAERRLILRLVLWRAQSAKTSGHFHRMFACCAKLSLHPSEKEEL